MLKYRVCYEDKFRAICFDFEKLDDAKKRILELEDFSLDIKLYEYSNDKWNEINE